MSVDQAVLVFAGLVILAGTVLTQLYSSWWLLLPAFVGLNLIQSVFTGFCPAAIVFRRLGLAPGEIFR